MAVTRPARVTIRDVAARAGVSHMTVSRVLNGSANVTPQRVQAVREAIESTGFLASASARQLATGTADAYAVVLTEPLDELLEDPTFATVLAGITDGLAPTPVVPILLTMATSQERAKGLRLIKRGTVDAVIHLSPYVDDGMLADLTRANIPMVLCGQPEAPAMMVDNPPPLRLCSVYTDDVKGGRLAAEHLLSRGAHRVASIMGPADNPATPERIEGLRDVLGDRLISITHTDWDLPAGYAAGQALAESALQFDAVACGNDRIAVGVLEALHEAGRKVPYDVRVVGFDDHPLAAMSRPPLTTVHQPFHEQGKIAVSLAAQLVAGGSPETVVLQPTIIVRDST